MPGPVFLEGESITLRTVEEEDIEFIRDNSNDPRIRRPMTFTGPSNYDQQEERHEEDVSDDDSVHLLVCSDDDPLGLVMLFRIHDRVRHAELAYWLTPTVHREGYMTEAVSLLLDHAFDQRNLHRVRARALVTNEASRGLLEKLGFTHEGTLRQEKWSDGEHVDVCCYGLLEDEWEGAP